MLWPLIWTVSLHLNHLHATVLMRGHNIWFQWEIRKIIPQLSSYHHMLWLIISPYVVTPHLNHLPSSEPSQWDSSDEGSQHMVSMRNKKNYPSIIIKYPSYLELCFYHYSCIYFKTWNTCPFALLHLCSTHTNSFLQNLSNYITA